MDRTRHKNQVSSAHHSGGVHRKERTRESRFVDKTYDEYGDRIGIIEADFQPEMEVDYGQRKNVGGEDRKTQADESFARRKGKITRFAYLEQRKTNHSHAALRVAMRDLKLVDGDEPLGKGEYRVDKGSVTYKTGRRTAPVTVADDSISVIRRHKPVVTKITDGRPKFERSMIVEGSRRSNKFRTLFEIDYNDFSSSGYSNLPKWDSVKLLPSALEYVVQWDGDNSTRVAQAIRNL